MFRKLSLVPPEFGTIKLQATNLPELPINKPTTLGTQIHSRSLLSFITITQINYLRIPYSIKRLPSRKHKKNAN